MEIAVTQGRRKLAILLDIYDSMCEFAQLYAAHLSARAAKRYRRDVLLFTDRLEYELFKLQQELLLLLYRVGTYRTFFVWDPKCRLIMALPYRDRIVQWTLYKQLNPFYDKMFIEDSYACRKGKGSLKAVQRLEYWLRQAARKEKKWYYLKLDISKYFYRVDHKILLSIFARRIKDERVMFLLEKIIDNENMKFGLPRGKGPGDCVPEEWLSDVGMPIGNLTSQLFANVYLNELDQYCKHQLHIHCYVRYMDDIIILMDSKEALHEVQEKIRIFLAEKLRLDLNRKTAIRPIALGIEFVGYKIWPTHKKLKKQSARRIIRDYTALCKKLANHAINREKFDRAEASYAGIFKYCNSYGLRQKLKEIYNRYMEDEKPMETKPQKPQAAPTLERNCYSCENFYRSWFCGYGACTCKVHGSLDVDQKERHPDTAAETCPDYIQK
jgi:retron-type reverse transcriptase